MDVVPLPLLPGLGCGEHVVAQVMQALMPGDSELLQVPNFTAEEAKHCVTGRGTKRPQSILHRTVPETHIMTVDDPEYLEEALNDVYEVRDMVEGKGQYNTRRSAGRRH